MSPMSNAQSYGVSVYAVSNHPIEDAVAWGKLVTGEKSYYAWVTVVELGRARGNVTE